MAVAAAALAPPRAPFDDGCAGIGASPGGINDLGSTSSSTPSGVDRFLRAFLSPRPANNTSSSLKTSSTSTPVHIKNNSSPFYSSGGSGSISSSSSSLNSLARTATQPRRARTSTSGAGHRKGKDSGSARPGMIRQRSRTDPSTTYGGIGESPAASHKSRQNSSSSSQHSNSLFSHRPSTSSATKEIVQGSGKAKEAGSPRANLLAGKKSNLPSIRDYTSFNDVQRPLTPLIDPFQRTRQQSVEEMWRTNSRAPAQLDTDSYPHQDSYVASLGMAPLVTRSNQGGEAVYIPGGRPFQPKDSQQLASTFYSPGAPLSAPVSCVPSTPPSQPLRPTLRQRSSSWNSYLGPRPVTFAQPFTGTFIRGEVDNRRSKSRTRSWSTRRKNSDATSDSIKLGSRFVKYDSCHILPSFHKHRSSSTGAVEVFQTSPRRDSLPQESPNHQQDGNDSRRSRSKTRRRSGGVASSVDRRKEESKQYRKLVSARLPSTPHSQRQNPRVPSQPLGLTWVCGSRLAARSPSFYDSYDYSSYPGGKRKRSFSTASNTLTPATGSTLPTPLAYESEPESSQQRIARSSSMHNHSAAPPFVKVDSGETALRRKSQSLVNLRQAAADGNSGLLISGPMVNSRSTSNHLICTPRMAPLPDMDIVGPSNPQPRASFGDISNNSQQIREALFAALPPPTRRSPTPNISPLMYPTGRLIATTVVPTYEYDGVKTPPFQDLADFAASRVIIGESQIGSFGGPERYPIVYGRAFSTENAKSVEGEIIDMMPGSKDSSHGNINLYTTGQSLDHSRTLSESSSFPDSNSSAPDSTHVLDLRDENFRNLFFAAPPSKPLPALPNDFSDRPPSDVPSEFIARGITSTPAREDVLWEFNARGRNSTLLTESTAELPSPWKPYATHSNRNSSASINNDAEGYWNETKRNEELRYPSGTQGQGSIDADEIESLRALDCRTTSDRDASEAENDRLLEAPHLAHKRSTDDSEYESEHYTTAGSANASAVSMLDLRRPVRHQPSFASAQTHLSKSSAARTIQRDAYEDQSDSAILLTNEDEPRVSDRRANRSHVRMHTLLEADSRPESTVATYLERPNTALNNDRHSFIEFGFENFSRESPAESSDAMSFLDDDDSDREESLAAPRQAPSETFLHSGREMDSQPRVVVESAETDTSYEPSLPASPYIPTSPISPTSPYASSTSEFIDGYRMRSNKFYRGSGASFALGVPPSSPLSKDSRNSGAASVSNASLLSNLSRLTDFPDPPPTSGTEKADPMESDLYLIRSMESETTVCSPRRSSLPIFPSYTLRNEPTLNGSSVSHESRERSPGNVVNNEARNSFLDLSTSPERPAPYSSDNQSNLHLALKSAS